MKVPNEAHKLASNAREYYRKKGSREEEKEKRKGKERKEGTKNTN